MARGLATARRCEAKFDAPEAERNAVNVVRTVKQLEKAGASGVQLEDQVFSKRCGRFSGKEVIETDEMVQKIKAAVDNRTDGDFVIVARTARACVPVPRTG